MKDTDTTREGEAFARVEKRRNPFSRLRTEGWSVEIGDEAYVIPCQNEPSAHAQTEILNKAADAHALKVGLRMLEMAEKLCQDEAAEREGRSRKEKNRHDQDIQAHKSITAFKLKSQIRSLAARIEKGDVVV